MQISVSARNLDVLVDQSPQRRGHGRRLLVPHRGVTYERQIELELGRVVTNEAEQVFGTALLLALDHHGNRQRQLAGDGLECAARLDEGHRLAFVVTSTARDN